MSVEARQLHQNVRDISYSFSLYTSLTIKPATPPMPDLLGGTLNSFKANFFGGFGRSAPPAVDTNAASKLTTLH